MSASLNRKVKGGPLLCFQHVPALIISLLKTCFVLGLKPGIIEVLEKQRNVELAELREKRKKLEEENAAKKEKERQEREEKAKAEGSNVEAQPTSGTRNPEGADEAEAGESTLNRTIEWSTPPRSTQMEVCYDCCQYVVFK